MSETDRDVLALLDRAAADSPPLHLDRESVIARGRQLARRRRAGGVGMAIGGLALAGAVWLGPGFGGGLLGTQTISPASVSWEVDEPTTVTVLDGVTRGGNAAPLTVTKSGDATTATFTVNGVEETVEGEKMAGGVDLFVGEGATVAVWADPDGDRHRVQPWPESTGSRQIGRAQGDEDLGYLIADPGYVPEDLIFSSDHEVWTASGLVAETAELTDGRVDAVAFALGDLDGDHPDEAEGGVLGSRVGGGVAAAQVGGHRGDSDDAAPIPLTHARKHGPGTQERTGGVDRHDAVPEVGIEHVLGGAAAGAPRRQPGARSGDQRRRPPAQRPHRTQQRPPGAG